MTSKPHDSTQGFENPPPYGFPQGQPGYPPGQQGYPQGQTGYPPGYPGHPQGQTGYPPGYPGHPQGQTGYPAGQQGYPQGQPGYPPGYPGHQEGQPVHETSPQVIRNQPGRTVLVTHPNIGLSPNSFSTTCPGCHRQVQTVRTEEYGPRTHFCALALCLMCCWPCALVPYCIASCKDIKHHCPECQAFIGTYYRHA